MLQDQNSGAGVCIGDYDADGLADIFFTDYNRGGRLYRNLGNWRFADVTEQAGLKPQARWCAGPSFVDIDNDGDLDLYVCVFNAPNLLYLNQGNGTFSEQAKAFGLDFSGASVMMAFADYDLDGRLDGYLVTHRLNVGTDHGVPRSSRDAFARAVVQASGRSLRVNPAYAELFELISRGGGRTELIIAGQRDVLFHNEGGGKFRAVNEQAGIRGTDIGLAATWWDYDSDGWPDLYVSNDYKGPDRLYRNTRNGAFTEVTRSALPHIPWASMGTDVSDLNNDGRLDLIATDMAGSTHARRMSMNAQDEKEHWFLTVADPPQYRRNAVFLGTGTERVMEAAHLAGLESTDWTWSPKFGDLDNDGWTDLFIANGMSRDFVNSDLLARMKERGNKGWLNMPILREANLAFRNLGDLRFESVGKKWGLDQISASYGAALADLDRDGDLDLVVTNFEEPVSIYRNTSTTGNRLLLRLKGTRANSWGLGATIRIETASGPQTRCLTLASGFLSANEPLVHFGLGPEQKVNRLTVEWPNRPHQTFENLEANRFYTITEPASASSEAKNPPQTPPWFKPATPFKGIEHKETEYDDYLREPLLPWKQSQLGPGLALGDVNSDGLDDIYLGGAAGRAGMLCLREKTGGFRLSPEPSLEADRASEDMGALFFDVDADGDADLYVVSGGVECEPGAASLRDRLYLNDGKGNFTKSSDTTLPDLRDSGSVVVAADFDRDDDLDLFVGGRSIPGQYPLPASSRILRNAHGRFTDATDELAPGLKQSGIVTSALWTDPNNDGWIDLLVTHQWGPVRFYLNKQGHLEDRTTETGLADKFGLWNGIAGRDLDGDGAIDYVVTNFGLNTQYRASPQKPLLAFYGEFDPSGRKHLIEAYYEGDTLYPVRGRSDLAAVMPFVAEKFPTFQSFSRASLADIFTPQLLASTQRFEVNTLESAVLLNDGSGKFTFQPLPRLAQIAPTFGVVLSELDGDGHADLYLVQNFFSPQPETGRMDGGVSLLLNGIGDGSFTAVGPHESGLIIPGDAKSLALTHLNNDPWPDFIAGMNNAEPLAFENRAPAEHRALNIRLEGKPGNPTAIGSRVTITLDNGATQTTELYAGGGYLSQSSSTLPFGLGKTNTLTTVTIRWPDGATTTTSNNSTVPNLLLKHPALVKP
jgi:hypothetical protein